MKKAWRMLGMVTVVLVTLLCIATAETVHWTNPTAGIDNTGATVPLTTAEQAALLGFVHYRIPPATTWTQFGTTTNGASSWTGNFPAAPGIVAEYNVGLGLVGNDNVLRKGPLSPSPVAYAVPFPPGPTPGSPSGLGITRQ